MSHKQLTNDPREFSAWLRQRAEGHAPGFDIAVYAPPSVWLALADAIEAPEQHLAQLEKTLRYLRGRIETEGGYPWPDDSIARDLAQIDKALSARP